MRRIVIGLVAAVGLAIIAFYGAWPAWSAHLIRTAFETRDPALLSRKVDFDGVRDSLTPVITAKVNEQIDARIAELGPLAKAIGPQLKQELGPRITALALQTLVTPEALIRIASEGKSIRESVERLMREVMVKMGDGTAPVASGDTPPGTMPQPFSIGGMISELGKRIGGTQAQPAKPVSTQPSQPAEKPHYSLANVKSLRVTSLTSFQLGLNRDALARDSEVLVDMAFRGGDWKLVGLTPMF